MALYVLSSGGHRMLVRDATADGARLQAATLEARRWNDDPQDLLPDWTDVIELAVDGDAAIFATWWTGGIGFGFENYEAVSTTDEDC